MSKYKCSKYSYATKVDGNGFIVFNSRSKELRMFSEKQYQELTEYDNDPDKIQPELKKECIKFGYLIPSHWDEKQIAELDHLCEIMNANMDLTIMPTEDCNFRCKYCYENFAKGEMPPRVQESVIKYVKKGLHKHTGLNISWFGGEPLIAMDIIENLSEKLIAICRQHQMPYSAGITTNGYNLTPAILNRLLKCRVNTIQVTLDGDAQNHDKLKVLKNGMPTYDRVLENLRYIRDYCKKRTLNVVIRTNVSQDLLGRIEDILKFYYEEFAADTRFSFYFRPVGDWGGTSINSVKEEVFEQSNYSRVYQALAQSTVQLNYKMYYWELVKNIDICYAAAYNSIVIGADGTIYKCTRLFDDDINHVGKLESDGHMVMDPDRLARWTMASFHRPPDCSDCPMFGSCYNATCIADQVRGLCDKNCPHMKGSLKDYLLLLSRDTNYAKLIIEE